MSYGTLFIAAAGDDCPIYSIGIDLSKWRRRGGLCYSKHNHPRHAFTYARLYN